MQVAWKLSDGVNEAVTLNVPAAVGVYVIVHWPVLVEAGPNVHEPFEPPGFSTSVSVPPKVVALKPEVSFAVAVQLVGALIGTGDVQLIVVEVGRAVTLMVLEPLELPCWESPP